MRRTTIIFVSLFFLSVAFLAGRASEFKPVQAGSQVPTIQTDLNPDTLLALVSQYRAENNLKPLKKLDLLCQFAQERADHIAKNDDWSHDGFQPLADQEPYYSNLIFLGENLARNIPYNKAILDAWINSPTHNENLLNRYYSYGCVALKDEYVVMTYGALH